MLRAERSLPAPSHGVRLLSLPAWSIAGSLLAATFLSIGTSDSLAQAAGDSVSSIPSPSPSPSPAPATSAPRVTSAPATSAPRVTSAPATSPQRMTSAAVQTKRRAYSLHLHGGLFAPIDVNAPSPTVGLRFGRLLGQHLQGGVLTGWTFRRKNLEQPVDGLPGLKPHLVLARLDGHLVPLMAFLQVNVTEKRFLVPYVGIAAGYEWISLVANDYRTLQETKSSYANWAWESWGGFGMRLDPKLRVDVELFYNGAKLERDVLDPSGLNLREAVDMNGVGARVGLDILF